MASFERREIRCIKDEVGIKFNDSAGYARVHITDLIFGEVIGFQ